MIIHSIRNENIAGTFNAVAPTVVTQKEFMQRLKAIAKKKALNFIVPAWMLKILLGEQASIVLEGANVSSKKIIANGFEFRYAELNVALAQLLNHE